jgi:phosphoribosylformylglycinamidine synthase
VTIGDRTVGGLCSRDPMVGPWQVPVADVAVTLMDFDGYAGEAMARGERTPLALIDAPASGRMAIGEALTNLAAAGIERLSEVKLSANWMAAAGHPGEDAALYDTVHAVAMELCPALGVSIPVGKDSMSMKTAWRDGDTDKEVTAPVSLIVSAFARPDARRVLTPQLRLDEWKHAYVLLVDLGDGGTVLAARRLPVREGDGRCRAGFGRCASPAIILRCRQALHAADKLLAYHDRSDGGLFAALSEMAFASRCGLAVELDALPGLPLESLFNEELGAVLQIHEADKDEVIAAFTAAGLRCESVGKPTVDGQIRIGRNREILFDEPRIELHRAWSKTSHAMQRLRDNPESADQEFERLLDAGAPGLSPHLTFDAADDIALPTSPRARARKSRC